MGRPEGAEKVLLLGRGATILALAVNPLAVNPLVELVTGKLLLGIPDFTGDIIER